MSLDFTVYFLFTFHIILLAVKMWALYSFTRLLVFLEAPSTTKYMLVFKPFEIFIALLSLLIVSFELYFIFSFFTDVELYFYEYASVLDQAFFTTLVVLYIKQEGQSHG